MSATSGFAESYDPFAVDAIADARATFIRKTYLHLTSAIFVFMGLEGLFLSIAPLRDTLLVAIAGNWWISLIAFMGVSWLANWWAHNGASRSMQYAGLAIYVVAQALIFVPLLTYTAQFYPEVIPSAGLLTTVIFVGLTLTVFATGADFSFLKGLLIAGSLAIFGMILASLMFGFELGLLFVCGALMLVTGYILYTTSNVLHHYRTDQHVAAALALFACVAELFWWMIRLLSIFSDE
ncbi:Bax inhibitor-1/YccA family protein [Calycomorphotria hydatis]|uniref:HflBKC-binding inner membrane protein n=1 Tax=Calycomorphotria hydatis TaxID=2528027 RepID=A0A517TAP8_9PLAN|nr:Bax inhibitor-1 family protein [Calycomorphotria hydatis]QDT65446.1 HflBKC-binding inner membrane protein [Calycomorphotria hydatis]